jgi:hypothetical protein
LRSSNESRGDAAGGKAPIFEVRVNRFVRFEIFLRSRETPQNWQENENPAFQIRSRQAQFCRVLRFWRLEKSISCVFSIRLNISIPPAGTIFSLDSLDFQGPDAVSVDLPSSCLNFSHVLRAFAPKRFVCVIWAQPSLAQLVFA